MLRRKEIADIYKNYSSKKVCKANEYIGQNKNAVDRFISNTKEDKTARTTSPVVQTLLS